VVLCVEVIPLIDSPALPFADSIQQATQRLSVQLRAQAEQIKKISSELTELQQLHGQTEREAGEEMARIAAFAAEQQVSAVKMLENVLAAVRAMTVSSIPVQVFGILSEEAARSGVRAVVFDVRGKSAWGATAAGFEPALSEKVLNSLIVPLNQDGPFRQVYDAVLPIETNSDALKKNRNLLDKLQPASQTPIVLLPILSAGAVAAILYADPRENGSPLPVSALKILAEFAGAHIDRLVALIGGLSAETSEREGDTGSVPPELSSGASSNEVGGERAPADSRSGREVGDQTLPNGLALTANMTSEPTVFGASAPRDQQASQAGISQPAAGSNEPPSSPALDSSQLSEADQKLHKDAKRFAKLLVSEIELYNKAKVEDGRKHGDLYLRLKNDIDRSRQTFEKRFGKSLSRQFPYFHEELVRTLAANNSSVLGPDYPGPS
jgi:hypothetical protein